MKARDLFFNAPQFSKNKQNYSCSKIFHVDEHGLRTPRQRFVSKISNFWAWADTLGWIFLRHLGYFRPDYLHPFWYSDFLVHVFHIQPLFLQKIKPLYPTPKYLFGSGICICAAKNLRFSLCVFVVRVDEYGKKGCQISRD